MLRQGKDVVSFAVGEPDFETPSHIREAGIAAIQEGWTKYSVTPGLPELREAICFLLKKRYGLEYGLPNVIVSVGAKQSIVNAMLAILEPGDEVLVPIPAWFSYAEAVKMLDGVPVFVPTRKEVEFQLKAEDLRPKITSRTKLIIFSTPNNPTGSMIDEKELFDIASLAVRHNFYIISDEIYSEIVFGNRKHKSIANVSEEVKRLTITINGFSKAYAMTGWRVGYAAASEEIIRAMSVIQGHYTSSTNTMAQRAALAAVFGPQKCISEMRHEYERRLQYMVNRLNAIPGMSCLPPHGTFYVFPDVSQFLGRSFRGRRVQNSLELGHYLLESEGIAVVPGGAFEGEGHLRLSFACSMETIKTGCDRIERALRS